MSASAESDRLFSLQEADELILGTFRLANHRFEDAYLDRFSCIHERDYLTIWHLHIDVIALATSSNSTSPLEGGNRVPRTNVAQLSHRR